MSTLIKALNKLEHAFIKAGVPQKDAEEALEALGDAFESKLATKSDIQAVKEDINHLEEKINVQLKYLQIIGVSVFIAIFVNIILNQIG